MTHLADSLELLAGIALLIAGGESLVRGSATLARQLGVPPLVIGLTVVAFGTSAPELAVNVTAALGGSGAVAFGNLVGSNLANVGLILAGAALLRSLAIQSIVVTRELPMMLLASAIVLVMGFDAWRGEPEARYDRVEGIVLLLLFGVFLYYNLVDILRQRPADALLEQARGQRVGSRFASIGLSAVLVVAGLAGLVLGGRLAVAGAVDLATALGVSKGLVGLTVIAVGTSLPELSACLLAARKGETDLAVGNVVGSNLFNLLFVLGTTATIRPVPVPAGGHADLLAMVGFAAVLLLAALRRRIGRFPGALLLVSYLAYVAARAL